MKRIAIWVVGILPVLGLGCAANSDTTAAGQALANQAAVSPVGSSSDGGMDVPRLCEQDGPPPGAPPPLDERGAGGCDADGGMPPGPRGPRPEGGPPPAAAGAPDERPDGHRHPHLDPAALCAAVADQCPLCPTNPRCVDLVARCAAGTVGLEPDGPPPGPAAPRTPSP